MTLQQAQTIDAYEASRERKGPVTTAPWQDGPAELVR